MSAALPERIRLHEDGWFHRTATGEQISFRDGDGTPVTLANMPEGCWPFAYGSDGQNKFVYFTYFLSRTLHKWRLDERGGRWSGENVSLDEVAPSLGAWLERTPDDAETQWLCAKLLRGVVTASGPEHADSNCFQRLERQAVLAAPRLAAAETPSFDLLRTRSFTRKSSHSGNR